MTMSRSPTPLNSTLLKESGDLRNGLTDMGAGVLAHVDVGYPWKVPGPLPLGCDLCQATAVLVAILSGSNSSPRSSDREDHLFRPPTLCWYLRREKMCETL